MISHLKGREKALESFGWTGRRTEWIALACLHGGVFTRCQWPRKTAHSWPLKSAHFGGGRAEGAERPERGLSMESGRPT